MWSDLPLCSLGSMYTLLLLLVLAVVGCSYGGRDNLIDNNDLGASADAGLGSDMLDPGPLVPSGEVSFRLATGARVGKLPFNLAVSDLNGDNKQDIVTADSGSGSISILLNDGNGKLRAMPQVSSGGTGPWNLVLSDLNRDKKVDIAVTNLSSASIGVLLGKGDGRFQAVVSIGIGKQLSGISARDFDRDGNVDLAVTDKGANTLAVLLGDGNGTFGLAKTYPTLGMSPIGMIAASIGGRNWSDLVAINYASATLNYYRGNGDGSFADPIDFPTSRSPLSGVAADFNFDGILDLAVSAEIGMVDVFIGQGGGNFSAPVSYPTGKTSQFVIAEDLNGDRIRDLAVTNSDSNTVSVLLGKGDGSFLAQKGFPTGGDAYGIGIADLDGDGWHDLVVSIGSTGTVVELMNNTPH